jgi:hypothetical protein
MDNLNTLSTKDLVKHFNALVVKSHPTVAQITVWKASKDALIAKIKALPKTPVVADRDTVLDHTKVKADDTVADKPTKPARVVKAKAPKAKKEKAVRKNQSDPEVGEYFAKHGLNPKVMRAKLRRAGFEAPYSMADIKALDKKED